MARALPADGEVVALELEPLHAKVIGENVAKAAETTPASVKVIVGPALESMQAMPTPTTDAERFDFCFIDADKENNLNYFLQAKRMVRSGGIIMVDNVGRQGKPADPGSKEASVEGVRALLRYIKENPEGVEATTIHTVGEKGFDGFMLAYLK
ncbi:hypothetical protein MKEN_00017800 [Mycena kentingensis (nom. inval.)]|nr:hypothetical protein MKEN_00017800 [Mycena kentingensis (nom. inval.)]